MPQHKQLLFAFIASCVFAATASAQTKPRIPEVVTIPAGQFMMGSPTSDRGRVNSESPQHMVTIKSFAMGKYDVTFDEWEACVTAGGCNGYKPTDRGWGRGNRPVIYVNWDDAQSYVKWLSGVTGQKWRLPTEAEWEYAARAGTTSAYYWGDSGNHDYANYGADECCQGIAMGKDKWVNTSPVGSFEPNKFGLYDMVGNVYQWMQDCANDNYQGAPTDGSAWLKGDCDGRELRGGSWYFFAENVRSAMRFYLPSSLRFNFIGIRVVREI